MSAGQQCYDAIEQVNAMDDRGKPWRLEDVLRFAHYAALCMLGESDCKLVDVSGTPWGSKSSGRRWLNLATARQCYGDSVAYLEQAGYVERHPLNAEMVIVTELPCHPGAPDMEKEREFYAPAAEALAAARRAA